MVSDETAYRKYLAGDEAAAQLLVERYGDALPLYISGVLGDIHEAWSCGSAFLDRANSAICCALALALPMISVLPASVVVAPPFSSVSFAATFCLNCAQWGRRCV